MRSIIVALLLLVFTSTTYAQSTTPASTKKEKIRTLLTISGTGKNGLQVIQLLLENYKKTMPNIPASFWDEFTKSLNADELVELLIPVYDKHFSESEIEALIVFYQSDIGKKFVEKQPLIANDGAEAGRKWGERIAKKIADKLKQSEYYKEN